MGTKTVHTCDGCGKMLSQKSDGIMLTGQVLSCAENRAILGPPVKGETVSAWCWKCFHEKCDGPGISVKRSSNDDDSPSYESSYRTPYREPGGGATGPLPPPELPHPVRFVSALTKV